MTQTIRNKSWAELEVGDKAAIERTCAVQDLILFAHVSGNTNPMMLPDGSANHGSKEVIAPSMWVGSLISAVLGNVMPGPGTLYRSQSLEFKKRVHVGDRLRITVTCCEKREAPVALFRAEITDQAGDLVCAGLAEIDAPTVSIETPVRELPALIVDHADHFAKLVDLAAQLPPLKTVIVCPEDRNSLGGALLSTERGLIHPVLIGDPDRISAAAREIEADISGWALVPETDHRAAAARAVAMVLAGDAHAVMKGAIHSDELLAAVVKKDGGLRTNGRISHVFALDVPTLDEILFISDAAINIAPDLMAKVDIVQNAIDLARACGLDRPRVGVLSAVETINPNIHSTLDAAVLSKMAERGQIKGGIVDGPLAMDNAIDMEAAKTKGIASLVAGHANVLIVPNLEAGNMLAKELTFIARAEAAGLVIGARVPVMLTSRADNDRARLASCALAQLYNHWRREGRAFAGSAQAKAAAEQRMTDAILTINAGSSSIKFAAYEIATAGLRPLARGHIDDIGDDTTFTAGPADGPAERQPIDASKGTVDHRSALELAVDWLRRHEDGCHVVAVGHRVVHGGPDHAEPVVIDDGTLLRLRKFVPLAPLHQPHNLAGIAAALHAFPDAAQVACFDTAFHRQHPFIADTFGLPRRLYDEGVRRYGFHGLSYEYVSRRLRSVAPMLASGRVIIAHLGNGASVCALRDGRSVASTMGFTALDGLPMGTRCGQLDPGVVLYLLTEKGMSPDEITHLLYHDSGLKGLSGLSNDMRELEASHAPAAREAIDYFVARVRREIAGLAATIGGVDAIVFAGGIGEHAFRVREQILGDMGWLGVGLDRDANARNAQTVSLPDSRVAVLVIPTDEDRMIAEHTAEILGLIHSAADSTRLTD